MRWSHQVQVRADAQDWPCVVSCVRACVCVKCASLDGCCCFTMQLIGRLSDCASPVTTASAGVPHVLILPAAGNPVTTPCPTHVHSLNNLCDSRATA